MQIWVDSWILARQESCNGQMAAPRVGYQAVSTCNGYVVPLECYPELKLLPELSLSLYIYYMHICTYACTHTGQIIFERKPSHWFSNTCEQVTPRSAVFTSFTEIQQACV